MILRPAALAGLACSVLFLPACFDFTAPIDLEPQVALDGRLLGTWRCLPSEPKADAMPVNFVVVPARDRVYSIAFVEDGEEPERYEAMAPNSRVVSF